MFKEIGNILHNFMNKTVSSCILILMFQLSTKYTGWIQLPLIDRPSVKCITVLHIKIFLSDYDETSLNSDRRRFVTMLRYNLDDSFQGAKA